MTAPASDRYGKVFARAQAALEAEAFAHVVTLDFGADGVVHVDGPAGEVRSVAGPADCAVTVSMDDFAAIARGELDPAMAYLKKRLSVEGDVNLAVALAARLRDQAD